MERLLFNALHGKGWGSEVGQFGHRLVLVGM
jgi:hypothetical protein